VIHVESHVARLLIVDVVVEDVGVGVLIQQVGPSIVEVIQLQIVRQVIVIHNAQRITDRLEMRTN
jgi:hypothetical protein